MKNADRYNLVVLGGGTAGRAVASGAAALGARVALVEKEPPNSAQFYSGAIAHKVFLTEARKKSPLSFAALMKRAADFEMDIRASHLLAIKDQVDIFYGQGQFIDRQTIFIHDTKLRFARAVIATGSRTAYPKISGLTPNPLTIETLLQLPDLPKKLAIVGSGALAAESAQAFARLGSDVTLYDMSADFLPDEDRDAAAIVKDFLEKDGVKFQLGTASIDDTFDATLVLGSRIPNSDHLNLDAAGVLSDGDGIQVNDYLRTTNSRIYACGDVISKQTFRSAAIAQARMVIGNALFFASHRVSDLHIPACVFTDPEIAHIGITETEAAARHFETLRLPFHDSDRARMENFTEGFVKIHHDRMGAIHGVTMVGKNASEAIASYITAMNHKIKLGSLAADIYPYPTYSEMIQQAGDLYRRRLLTPFISNVIKKLLEWRR